MLGFFLGVLVGAMLVVAYGTYEMIQLKAAHEAAKKKKDPLKELKDKMAEVNASVLSDAERAKSIRDRLNQAAKLAEEQASIRAQAEMPSKNSLHSRHKNGLVGQMFELEAQKISILRTILGEGFDPMITVVREGGVAEEVPLSEYVSQAEETMNATNPYADRTPGTMPEASSSDQGPRKAGKFVVYTGGRDDGSGTIH